MCCARGLLLLLLLVSQPPSPGSIEGSQVGGPFPLLCVDRVTCGVRTHGDGRTVRVKAATAAPIELTLHEADQTKISGLGGQRKNTCALSRRIGQKKMHNLKVNVVVY